MSQPNPLASPWVPRIARSRLLQWRTGWCYVHNVTPTGPTAATLLEGDLITGDEADPQVPAALIHFSGPFNLTGFPAVSIPCGFTPSGLSVGVQLVGKPWQEGPLLAAAHAYEQFTDWHRRLPVALRS